MESKVVQRQIIHAEVSIPAWERGKVMAMKSGVSFREFLEHLLLMGNAEPELGLEKRRAKLARKAVNL